MANSRRNYSRFQYLFVLVILAFILPVIVLAFLKQTNNPASAAPLPPRLDQVFTGGSSSSSRVTVSNIVTSPQTLYLASISTKPYASVTSISGLGLTWTRLKAQCAARNTTGVEIWMAVGSPTSGTSVSVNLSKAPLNSVAAVSRFSNIDLADPVSSVLSFNTRGVSGTCTGGIDTDKYSMPFSSGLNSLSFGSVAVRLRTHTPGSGFSEAIEFGRGSEGDRVGLALVQSYSNPPGQYTFSGELNSGIDWAAALVQVHGNPEPFVPTPTVRPSSTPAPTLTPRPSQTVPTSTPTVPPPPSVTPRPTSTPAPLPTQPPIQPVVGIWTSPAELSTKPMSGDAWAAVKSAADSLSSTPNPDLDNQDDPTNVQVLAAAIVYARTGDTAYRTKVVAALQNVTTDQLTGRSLAWARESGAYAMAADLIGYRDAAFVTKMRNVAEVYKCSQLGVSLLDMYKMRPNNWGSQAFGSLTAIYRYLGDTGRLTEIRDYYLRNLLGPKPSASVYGDLSWQCSSSDPRMINPKGCVKVCGGVTVNVDGIIPDDMRRGGSCSSTPVFTGYPWEGLQGYVMAARILERAGMSIWEAGDKALCRAASALQDRLPDTWNATGDDEWQLPFLDRACGTHWSASYSGLGIWKSGKNTGWGYVLP